jgi:predicted GNAT superfamily acetyltransferase
MTLATSLLDAAASAVDRACRRAGVTVLELRTPAETERAAELLREVWRGAEMPVPANLLRTVQHTGGYVHGAYDETGALLAASMGLLASLPDGPALHSHITGVVPAGQRRGLGFAVKQHQRLWALERGLSTITWTCDPLVRRNVLFNLHALGATVDGYLPDHYGAMTDGVNKGDESDRFELRWDLGSARAAAAAEGRLPVLDADLPYAVAADDRGLPVASPVTGTSRLVQLPADIEGLRRGSAAVGLAWRRAVREAVVPALSEGAVIRGLTADGALVLEVCS